MNILKSQIDLSIWLISYNHVDYIREALDSVLSQKTKYTYEIVITDDASNDGTSCIIREYAEKYPDKIKAFIKNKNCGNPRTNMIENNISLQGNYWCMLETDDYWASDDKIEKQLDFLYAHPDYIGSNHAFVVKDEVLGNEVIHKASLPEWDIYKALKNAHTPIYYLYCHTTTYVWKNVFLGDIKSWIAFLKDKRTYDDTLISFRMMSYGGRVRYFDETMSCYRRTNKGVVTSLSKEQLEKHSLLVMAKIPKAVFLKHKIYWYYILIRTLVGRFVFKLK